MTLAPSALGLSAIALALLATPALSQQAAAPDSVHFYGLTPQSSIAAGVVIPAGRAMVWTSGTVPPVFNERAEAGTRERFGDTKIQATGVLRRIEDQLAEQGLSLREVVYIRAYLVPDPQTGAIDMRGWSEAYADFFGTAANPTRPARSTVGVAALVNPDWLIEIEAFAVHP
ncbi:MAG TPA: RidA family protein [Longimicrobiaceae bacterium]|nr:RidA family protein [Longimicrobiaceae bacterium]